MNSIDYRSITALQAFPSIATEGMFDTSKAVKEPSPVDMFLSDTEAINKLYLRYVDARNGVMPDPLGSLVLLGYTSAVESYFRAVLRRSVLVDDISRQKAEPLTLSFGAALHHAQKLLPEALLEDFSFAGRRGIVDAFETVLGIKVSGGDVEVALSHFSRICEIRHCCVHRSGRLGSRNAMKLGLDVHSKLLERPFRPSVDELQTIADLLRTFVKTINNFLFGAIIDRTVYRGGDTVPAVSHVWKWNWSDDRQFFRRYYDVYASTSDLPASPSAKAAYESFLRISGPGGERWLEKRRERQAKAPVEPKPAAAQL